MVVIAFRVESALSMLSLSLLDERKGFGMRHASRSVSKK